MEVDSEDYHYRGAIEKKAELPPVHPGDIIREDMLPETSLLLTGAARALIKGIAADASRHSGRAPASFGGDVPLGNLRSADGITR